MSLDLWIFNKHRRTKMNAATLDAIIDNSYYVKDEVVLGCEKAKKELQECLPLERGQFVELAKDQRTDFIKGYDDKYPRVDMSVVENAVKKMNGELVPAFAIYNTNSYDNEYAKRYKLTNSERYEVQSEMDKKMVPHSKFGLKLKNHFYRKWRDNQDGIGFCVFGVFLQLSNFLWFVPTFGAHLVGLGLALSGAFIFLYGLGVYNWEPNRLFTRTFKHKFSGVIPKEIRKLVLTEQTNFDNIYLVEESHSWKIDDKIVEVPKNLDPLIIGKKNNVHFLLAKFDVTPLENIIATEYSA